LYGDFVGSVRTSAYEADMNGSLSAADLGSQGLGVTGAPALDGDGALPETYFLYSSSALRHLVGVVVGHRLDLAALDPALGC
jgi:hypothetical protein